GLHAIRDGRVRIIRNDQRQVTSMMEDHAGRLWVGVEDTLSIYERGRFTTITRRDGTATGMIVGLAEDTDRNVWAEVTGPVRQLLRITDDTVQEELPAPQMLAARKIATDPTGGIWLGLLTGDLAHYRSGRLDRVDFERPRDAFVRQIGVNPDRSVIAATEFGLLGWRNGVRRTLTTRNGLPCDTVNAFVADAKGGLWLYLQCGLVEVAGAELEQWWAQPEAVLRMRTFDAGDGVQPGAAAFHGAARTPDGRLWFANGFVVQMIDPARVDGNIVPAPVVVEAVVADRARYPADQVIRVPPLVRDLQIDYTALSFGAPQRVRFRYKLEGRDPEWQEPGTRRQAFYNDLPPGSYRFRVTATNNDGLWNEAGATLDFSLLPAWYQTKSARALLILAVALLAWIVYHMRLRQLRAQFNLGLEARVGERTRIARALHDTLLQSQQGLLIHFQAATNLLPGQPDEAKHRLDRVIERAAAAITEGRNAVQDLRSSGDPPNDLAQAISVLGDSLVAEEDRHPMTVRVNVEGTPRSLHPLLRDDVYRIAAEAMRNAVRHAGGGLMQVDIHYDDRQLQLRVRDDGKGIAPGIIEERASSGHWGLPGMHERASLIGGTLEVLSQLGSGTEVSLRIPARRAYVRSPGRRPRWWFRLNKRSGS
ncbi:MAG: triple tyrosine motif-containing protein, partial [Vicinamibacterales bacterium]